MTANDRPPAIFLVTGSMASGKSTVGPLLAARFERAVCIEGDVFRRSIVRGREEMTPQPSEEALAQLRLRYAIAAAAAVAYVDAGFTAVVEDVVAGPLLEEFTRLVVRAPLHVVVLLPSVEVIAAREADRGGGGYTAWLPAQLHGGCGRDRGRARGVTRPAPRHGRPVKRGGEGGIRTLEAGILPT